MYICAITGNQSKPGEKCHRLVVETRPKTYKHWDRESEEEWFTQGTEIVREVNATRAGVDMWNGMTPEQQVSFLKRL